LPLLLAAIAAGGWYFDVRTAKESPELQVYVRGGERMAAGEEIYRRESEAKPFTYPPFAAVPFVPFAWLPERWQPTGWFAVNLLVLLPILFWLHRWAVQPRSGSGPPRRFWFWLLVALLAGRHVMAVFKNQSNDLLLFGAAMLGVAAWVGGSLIGRILAGGAFGMAGAFKATPMLFLEMTVLRRAWLASFTLLVAAVALSWLPDLFFPRVDGQSWVFAWYDINLRAVSIGSTATAEGAWGPHSILNQGLSGTLTRLFSPAGGTGPFVRHDLLLVELPASLLGVLVTASRLLVVGVIAWGVLRAARAARAGAETGRYVAFAECGLVLCGMVLLSPQSSKAHFCILLVPAAFCVDWLLRGRRDLVLWCLVLGSVALASATAKDILGREFGNRVLGWGAVTWATVLLMLANLRALRGVLRATQERAHEDSAASGQELAAGCEEPEWTGEEQPV